MRIKFHMLFQTPDLLRYRMENMWSFMNLVRKKGSPCLVVKPNLSYWYKSQRR